jgi:hypothetical protein
MILPIKLSALEAALQSFKSKARLGRRAGFGRKIKAYALRSANGMLLSQTIALYCVILTLRDLVCRLGHADSY